MPTVDDVREVMAYYKIEADDRALDTWQRKMEEIQKKKARGRQTLGGGG